MTTLNRRHFLRSAVGLAATALAPAAQKRSATDWVELGNSGVKVTRLAFGTGTFGGRVQRELGQEEFTKLVRYAYDRGIRFFETAQNYAGMHEMLGKALKGLPRDSYRLMTKYRLKNTEDPKLVIDQFRKELNTDYFDILLLHCVRTADWTTQFAKLQDEFSEAKHRKIILAHGASCHGLLPLRAFPGHRWLDVALLRVNHKGTRMDNLQGDDRAPGVVEEPVQHIAKLHEQKVGVIGMKIMGEGAFQTPQERDASIRFVMKLGTVDAITIGYKNTQEIDEAIERMNRHLNS
ncbi:MAG: aldo/keto reductase [Bryobacteraceae bacterium]|nr:aldo/keto reductase [Bryobacteraceae bacterium]MDW8377976.1 aldo/keto reductase [Bryobacterales bacterium]